MDPSPADHTPDRDIVRYHLFWKGGKFPVRVRLRLNFIEAQRQILSVRKRTKVITGFLTGLIVSAFIWWLILVLV